MQIIACGAAPAILASNVAEESGSGQALEDQLGDFAATEHGLAAGLGGGLSSAADAEEEALDLFEDPEHASAADYAKNHAKQRSLAWQWVCSDPWPYLLLMMLVLKPFAALLHGQLQLGGQKWQQQQDANMARAMLQGNSSLFARKFGVVESALGVLDMQFLDKIKALFGSSSV
eukprot:2283222-Amphidinium_carterae.2